MKIIEQTVVTLCSFEKKIKSDPYFRLYNKWIAYLNMKNKTIKYPQKGRI